VSDVLAQLRSALSDRYEVERELGHGGMATVYLAHDRKLDRQVALKVLRPELASSLGGERFLRETEIAARLTHPNILALFDRGEADGLLYYTMPYVEGESLGDRLTRERQLPLEDALRITQEVADALEHAHAQGIVHRDIKPENILFEGGHAVVADFGIARAIDVAGGERLTETGLAVGTPAYMSPEQASGVETVDARSDQYALACVLYEMLAGEPPFPGTSAQAILARKVTEPPRAVRTVRRTVPEGVEQVLQRGLATAPADRYATPQEFVEALQQGVAAPPTGATTVAQRVLLGLTLVVVLAGALVLGQWLRPGGTGSSHPRTAIAVLPFENRTADASRAYFASGLHDELLTQLAKVAALKVISRTSVMSYVGTTKPLSVIADELRVGSIVEASVQVEGERLRVNVRLIDVASDESLWAEGYERTLDDAFAIQSAMAQQIVGAVGAALTEDEASAIGAAPTDDPEAYRLYLQGEEYRRRPGFRREELEIARQLYERALTLDPAFALARARLSEVHGEMYQFGYDPSAERVERQRAEAEAALRLAPDLPQARVAMGYVHYVSRDYRRALEEYAIALEGLPNDAEAWAWAGFTHRRLGNWDEVLAAFERAAQLDPRDANLFQNLGGVTYRVTHRYADAVRAFDRALTLDPGFHMAAVDKGWIYIEWRGELDTMRVVLDRLGQEEDIGLHLGSATLQRATLLLWGRQADSLLGLLATAQPGVMGPYVEFSPPSLYAGWAHQLRGHRAAAREAFDSARVFLDSVLQHSPQGLPNEWAVHAARGLALAGLGWRDEALREAGWLEESAVYREDAFFGPIVAVNRAWILAQAGAADAALEEIERLLTAPSVFATAPALRLDPRWDPIRDHPRFQALLVEYADPQPVR
jgi:serine/threonine-protein kinase